MFSILPKEFVFENAMADLSDEQIDEVIERIREQIVAARSAQTEAAPVIRTDAHAPITGRLCIC